MNTLVIVLIAALCLFGAYTLYGRWLANKWGIDPAAKTPAVVHEDGRDYVPTNGWTVFAHQFSSIAGAGPVTGAIQAAAFGWLPVLLWVLLGGIFFGAVTDFGALYASVKNDGKSMGMLIEKYIGKTGRKLFLLFCWLFCGIVIAAFADMVAGTFNAFGADGAMVEAAQTNGAAGMVSIMFMVFAVVFGLLQKKFNFSGWKESVISIVFIVLSFVIGANLPLILGKAAWSYITFVYIFFAAVLPMWLLKQPRDHMTTFMFVAMIVGAVVGLLVAHPTMNLPVFTGFTNEKLGTMFPILFVTVACGAVSGFHSLVSSGTSSKTVENEKDMLKVGYGAMILESLLAVLALCVAGAAAAADGTPAAGTPFQIFSRGVAGFFEMFGVPVYVENDTNAQCMGEHELCRARDLVYVSAGTGVGAGVMLDGRLRRGETNKCGEIGYNVFFEDYKRTARAAGCLEQRIGYHVLEQQFALDRFSRRSQIPPALLAQMAAQVTKPLALCIANLTHVLDCSTVVLGGEVAELLGDALLDALNARLEELCLSPVRVRRPASADDGLIGMAAHITRMEVDALLEEE